MLLILAVATKGEDELVGYDCSMTSRNITTVSLMPNDECNIQDDKLKTENVTIDLFELNDLRQVKVIHC